MQSPMGKQPLTVLLVEDDTDYVALVQHWLSESSDASDFLLNWTDSLTGAKARLEQGGIDVVLLDLGLPESNGIGTFRRIRASLTDVPVVILTSGDSESLALEIIQQGAQDYLVKNACTSESLSKAIRYAHLRHNTQIAASEEPKVRTVAVLGAKGGVGATMLACTLAVELRLQASRKTLLADLELQSGLVSFYLGLVPPKYSILDAVGRLGQLDTSMWESLVVRSTDQVDVLVSPSLLNRKQDRAPSRDRLDQAGVTGLLAFTASLYDWVVLDLGRLDPVSLELMNAHTDLLLVSTAAIPSLYAARQILARLDEEGVDSERVHLIINGIDGPEAMRADDLNKLFSRQVYVSLPCDGDGIHQALLEKRLPARSSPYGCQVANLVRRLAGIEEVHPKRKAGQFFSFLRGNKADVVSSVGIPSS